jgi:phosphatidylserine/phosphatidylglycerophosphate/cardiolipin synthase-like enzyme
MGVGAMTIQSFDIDSLLRFNPPHYLCVKCYALLRNVPSDWKTRQMICPVCKVEYCSTEGSASSFTHNYLRDVGLELKFDDLIGHSRRLATIAQTARRALNSPVEQSLQNSPYPPMRALFESLLEAQKFVHFTTYGISHMILGALKTAAQRVPVRGIVSDADDGMVSELTQYKEEAPNLETILFERGVWAGSLALSPHHKIVVIDGLIAFKGSANLTLSGLRKAAQWRDTFEIVTDVKEVVELHNRFFSPIWAQHYPIERIDMGDFQYDIWGNLSPGFK